MDQIYTDIDKLMTAITEAKNQKQPLAIGYLGNVVELWEKLAESDVKVELGSD